MRLVLSLALVALAAAASKPNIVMILVDDWGYADIGYHRETSGFDPRELSTPNLDALASQGVIFENAYSFHWCTPSRSSFLSGRLPLHVFQNPVTSETVWNPLAPDSAGNGIPRNMTTMPRFLKEAGYATHMTGKHHMGFATREHLPIGRGFDTSLVYLTGANNYRTFNITDSIFVLEPKRCDAETPEQQDVGFADLWADGGPVADKPIGKYEDDVFYEFVEKTLKGASPDEPFFLYWTPHIAHAPLTAPEEYLELYSFIEDPARRHYHAMVAKLDDLIGNFTETLKSTGLWDNTYVFVQADNGGPVYDCGTGVNDYDVLCGGANNYPFRGGKISAWQGGIHVNSFVSGGALPADRRGVREDGMIHLADMLATYCDIAGVDCSHDPMAAAAKLPQPDSLSMLDMILGKNSTSPRTEYPITGTVGGKALIQGDWKLLTGNIAFPYWTGYQYPNVTSPNNGTGFSLNGETYDCQTGCLFNIREDPAEHNDVAAANPDIVNAMVERLKYWEADTFNPHRGLPDARACDSGIAYGHTWGPFVE